MNPAISPYEPSYLGLGRPPQELIELFKMDFFFAAPYAIKSADQQGIPHGSSRPGQFRPRQSHPPARRTLAALVVRYSSSTKCSNSGEGSLAMLSTRARRAGPGRNFFAFLHCKQFSVGRPKIEARLVSAAILLACTVRQIGCVLAGFGSTTETAPGQIQPERQKPRENGHRP